MDTEGKKLIVVLGMHRSGTSVITRGLQVMGVGLGENLMPPVQGNNDKGFWEDLDVNSLNIEVLKSIENDWYYLAPFDTNYMEKLRSEGYLIRAVELLHLKASSTPVFGFKDPRVAKLLPFWKAVFSYGQFNVNYVLALRHPLSVVKSLAKRDGFAAEHSYLLWLAHVIESLRNSAGSKQVVVDYDCLMLSPDVEMMRISEGLGLEIDPAELQSYKAEFLQDGLRHTVYCLNDLLLDNACPPIVSEIYTALLDVAADKVKLDDKDLQEKVSGWLVEYERLKSPLLLIDGLFTQKDARLLAIQENADKQINYRDELINQLEKRMLDIERNAEDQIAYRDDLIALHEKRMLDIERNAEDQIAYRDDLIALHEKRINRNPLRALKNIFSKK